jgi:hypothetical protein
MTKPKTLQFVGHEVYGYNYVMLFYIMLCYVMLCYVNTGQEVRWERESPCSQTRNL